MRTTLLSAAVACSFQCKHPFPALLFAALQPKNTFISLPPAISHAAAAADCNSLRLAHNYLKKQCEAAAFEVAYISDCISDCDVIQSAQWQVHVPSICSKPLAVFFEAIGRFDVTRSAGAV